MKLILDYGNTHQKLAIFQQDSIVLLEKEPLITVRMLRDIFDGFPGLTTGIISSVVPLRISLTDFLHQRLNPFLVLNHHTPIPLINKYRTPANLGKDRLSSAVAASRLFEGVPALVINAGSCITYDLVNENNEYLGGAISPGLQMRLNAMHTFTHKLPLVSLQDTIPQVGDSTKSSILSGAVLGAVEEIRGIVYNYRKLYPNLQVILSGGDMEYLDKLLKIRIFAFPNIVMVGLNYILEHNLQHAR